MVCACAAPCEPGVVDPAGHALVAAWAWSSATISVVAMPCGHCSRHVCERGPTSALTGSASGCDSGDSTRFSSGRITKNTRPAMIEGDHHFGAVDQVVAGEVEEAGARLAGGRRDRTLRRTAGWRR